MTELNTRDIPLNWDVFVTPGIPMVTSDPSPGTKQGMWSPISSTLAHAAIERGRAFGKIVLTGF